MLFGIGSFFSKISKQKMRSEFMSLWTRSGQKLKSLLCSLSQAREVLMTLVNSTIIHSMTVVPGLVSKVDQAK